MAYNNITSRTDAAALIPEEVSNEMLGKATQSSAAMTLFKNLPVARGQVRFPVLSALPVAYFVNGDTGLKQTTEVNWSNVYLNIEEIATIMPVPNNVLADVDANIWDAAMPLLTEAFSRTLDAAIFFGVNAPSSWPTNVAAAAATAGNSITSGSTAAQGGFFGDIDKLYGTVESDGYRVKGFVGDVPIMTRLRSARDTQGRKLDEGRVSGDLNTLDGLPIAYAMEGQWPTGTGSAQMFGGDWSRFILGIRDDISMMVLDQAAIFDNTGALMFNLPQQDMTAVRLTFRVGWQVSNGINNQQPTAGSRYPAGVLVSA